jgi:adenylate cyclase class 2
MQQQAYEVEVKFLLADLPRFREELRLRHALPIGEIEQEDRYFNHPVRDFRQSDEALRLRRCGDRNRITYKGPKLDTVSKTRREIELDFASGLSSIAQFAEILTLLGFVESGTVRKRREQFELVQDGLTIEITIDHVAGLGDYVELEAPASSGDIDMVRSKIIDLAAQLGLSGSERRSYLELLVEKQRT